MLKVVRLGFNSLFEAIKELLHDWQLRWRFFGWSSQRFSNVVPLLGLDMISTAHILKTIHISLHGNRMNCFF